MFRLARWFALASAALTVFAMVLYPGGTGLDPSTHGYSLFQNSLSDLGSTVALNGQANGRGALCFMAGFAAAAITGIGCFVALVRAYSVSAITRRLARAAGAAGALSCAGLLAAALTPEDRYPALHLDFSRLALFAFIAAILLFAWTTALDERIPRGVPAGWLVLELVLVAWLSAITMMSPPISYTAHTLAITLQKIVAIAILAVFVFQLREAERGAN